MQHFIAEGMSSKAGEEKQKNKDSNLRILLEFAMKVSMT